MKVEELIGMLKRTNPKADVTYQEVYDEKINSRGFEITGMIGDDHLITLTNE